MVSKDKLIKLLEEYEINGEKVIRNNSNILSKGEYDSIKEILDYLRDDIKIGSKNIEKCPSILYSNGVDNIRENYEFLKEKEIKNYSVETCLHILLSNNRDLKEIYKYVEEKYGDEILNKYTSLLAIKKERLQEIEERFKERLSKENIFSSAISKYGKLEIEEIEKIVEVCEKNGIEVTGSVFRNTAEEIEKIVEVCKENGIEVTGSVFLKTAEEIEKIVEVCKENGIEVTGSVFFKPAEEIKKIVEICKENGIEVTGSVFMKTAEEIEKIVEVCKKNGIEVTGNVFLKTAKEIENIVEVCEKNGIEVTGSVFKKPAEEIEKIVEVCKENGIEVTGSVFLKTAKQLKENIDYVKETFGKEYCTRMIITRGIKNLKSILPYLKEKGVLRTLITSSSILSLTLDEVKERENYVVNVLEEPLVIGDKFNSIFGFSKKNYNKKVKESQIAPETVLENGLRAGITQEDLSRVENKERENEKRK